LAPSVVVFFLWKYFVWWPNFLMSIAFNMSLSSSSLISNKSCLSSFVFSDLQYFWKHTAKRSHVTITKQTYLKWDRKGYSKHPALTLVCLSFWISFSAAKVAIKLFESAPMQVLCVSCPNLNSCVYLYHMFTRKY